MHPILSTYIQSFQHGTSCAIKLDILHLLGKLGQRADAALPIIEQALHNPHEAKEVRVQATIALCRIGLEGKSIFPFVLDALSDRLQRINTQQTQPYPNDHKNTIASLTPLLHRFILEYPQCQRHHPPPDLHRRLLILQEQISPGLRLLASLAPTSHPELHPYAEEALEAFEPIRELLQSESLTRWQEEYEDALF